jgi:hypothetical protein
MTAHCGYSLVGSRMKTLLMIGASVIAFAGTTFASPGLRVIPRRINFGRVQLAADPPPLTKQFTVVNRSKTETISAVVSAAFGAFQSQAVTLNLPPQQSVIIQVNFNPPVQAKYIEVISVTPDVGRSINVILRGRAKGARPATAELPTTTPTPIPTLTASPAPTATPTDTPVMLTPTPSPSGTPAPTATPTATSTPTPMLTATATSTPTPTLTPTPSPAPSTVTYNAGVMMSFNDPPNVGNGQLQLSLIVEDPVSQDTNVFTASSAANGCIVFPVKAPVNRILNFSIQECGGGAIDYNCPALPVNPQNSRSQIAPQEAFSELGDPELAGNILTVGIAPTGQSAPGGDPNTNIVDPQGYGLLASTSSIQFQFATADNQVSTVGPMEYQVIGCNGSDCPFANIPFYNDSWVPALQGDISQMPNCILGDPVQ